MPHWLVNARLTLKLFENTEQHSDSESCLRADRRNRVPKLRVSKVIKSGSNWPPQASATPQCRSGHCGASMLQPTTSSRSSLEVLDALDGDFGLKDGYDQERPAKMTLSKSAE